MALAQPASAPRSPQRARPDVAPRPELHLVPAAVPPRGNLAFFTLGIMLLVVGLIGSLALNTLMAEGSYRQADLQREIAEEAQTRDRLQTELNFLNTPEQLAKSAQKLGMTQQQAPLMIRLEDQRIIGLEK